VSGEPYARALHRELEEAIDSLALDDMQRRFLVARWLDQVTWMEAKSGQARDRYYALRLTTVIGAVVVPGLVGLDAVGGTIETVSRIATWLVSLVVAISAAVEQFFHFGERWHHYRETTERLKAEGWLYFQLAGPYAGGSDGHSGAYPLFAQRVEEILKSDVSAYVSVVTAERSTSDSSRGS